MRGVETAVLVPIKSFRDAKGRLSAFFTPAERADLARRMAAVVLDAAAPMPVFVACDDDEVADWVGGRGAEVLWTPGLGLNGAIEHGVEVVAGKGFSHVVVTHSDIPLARSFTHLCEPDTVVLVPDQRLDGTNVQARPAVAFEACYGAGSFRRHLTAALASGRRTRVVVDAGLALDVDTIDELRDPRLSAAFADVLARTDRKQT